jgi:hypothetical protein
LVFYRDWIDSIGFNQNLDWYSIGIGLIVFGSEWSWSDLRLENSLVGY